MDLRAPDAAFVSLATVFVWLSRAGFVLALLLVASAVWAIYAYDASVTPLPALCLCTARWESLDERWRRFLAAIDQLVAQPCYPTISAAAAAAGHLIGWFFGRRTARAPLDDLAVAAALAAFADCGCVGGRQSLVPVVRVGPQGGELAAGPAVRTYAVEHVCPTLATLAPLRYIRAEALSVGGFLRVPGPDRPEEARSEPSDPGRTAPDGGRSPHGERSSEPSLQQRRQQAGGSSPEPAAEARAAATNRTTPSPAGAADVCQPQLQLRQRAGHVPSVPPHDGPS